MFYLGRSYMIGNKTLNILKIGSLAFLLGIFGIIGSTNAATDACHALNPANDGNFHKYTCENPGAKLCTDGSTDQRFPQACSSSTLKCHRCIPKVVTPTCTATQKLNTTSNTCEDIAATSTTAAPGNGLQCKEGFIPDVAGTSCISKPVTQTPQEACEAKTDWKWEDNECKSCSAPGVCCGVELNTDVPFVGKCIRLGSSASTDDTTVVTETTAFPRLMGGLTKILTTLILLACFGGILAGGVMIASSGGETTRASEGKKLIKNVVIAIALLGTSGIILKLINPNFFG